MRSFLRKPSWRIRRNQREAELEEEIRFPLEEEADAEREEGDRVRAPFERRIACFDHCLRPASTARYRMAWRGGREKSESAWRLGAQRKGVLWMALGEALLIAFAGLAIGAPAASKLVRSFLFGMQPDDPPAYAAAAIPLSAAALAAFLPARNASRTDPMTALGHQ